MNRLLLIFLFIISFVSCKRETELHEMYYDYFPVEPGVWVVYDVDSIHYNDFTGMVDSFLFQVKELVHSVFTDAEGRPSVRIERYYMMEGDSVWHIRNVSSAHLSAQRAELYELNVRYIKLIFPIRKSARWDGHKANNLDEVKYEYVSVHEPYTLNFQTIDSCVSVLHFNEPTLFSDKYSEEVYALHVGKVYRHHRELIKQADGKITSGFNYTYRATSWGK